MKIPNPWPSHPYIRFNVNDGDCLGSCGPGPEIEVPDTAVVVLIEPVNRGRYNSNPLAPGRIWSKEFGTLDVEDHLKKVQIKEEETSLKVRQEADRLRKQDEAKVKAVKERTDEMYGTDPDVLIDPVTGANVSRKEHDADIKARVEADKRTYQRLKQEKAEAKNEKVRQQGVEVKDPVGIEIQTHEKAEPKAGIDVERAVSGLAKITKTKK